MGHVVDVVLLHQVVHPRLVQGVGGVTDGTRKKQGVGMEGSTPQAVRARLAS